MKNLYVGRQPILDIDGVLDSYEVLYSQKEQANGDGSFIFATILSDILNKIGTNIVLGRHKAFVQVDEEFLFSEKILTISNEFFILCLANEIEISEEVLKRLQELKAKEYTLALDNVALDVQSIQKYEKVLNEFSFIKINIHDGFVVSEDNKSIVSEIKEKDITIVGTSIVDKWKFELAKSLGCELFQGYFFSKAKVYQKEEYNPSRLNILKLYSLLVENASLDAITEEFKKNNSTAILLLQYINSGAFHFKNKISSMHHILTLVGRDPLAKWLMLIIYSMSKLPNPKVSPLMLMVKNRTELMESIVKSVVPDASKSTLDQAYFVGVLSLIDILFGEKLETVLDEMNVYDIVRKALLEDSYILGETYALVRDIEDFKPQAIADFEKKYTLEDGTITEIVIKCMQEVTTFEKAVASIEG